VLTASEARFIIKASVKLASEGAREEGLRLAYAGLAASDPERTINEVMAAIEQPSELLRSSVYNLSKKGYPTEATNLLFNVVGDDPKIRRGLWSAAEHELQGSRQKLRPQVRPGAGHPAISRKTRTKAEKKSTAHPELYFELQGNGAQRNQVKLASDVDLHFKYGVPGEDVLAKASGGPVDKVKEGIGAGKKLDIGVYVAPVGLDFQDEHEDPYQVARFRGGKMENSVVFHLRSPGNHVEQTGIRVILTLRGAELYRAFIPVELVAEIGETASAHTIISMTPSQISSSDSLARDVTAYFQRRKGGAEYVLTITRRGAKAKSASKHDPYINVVQLQTVLEGVTKLTTEVAENNAFEFIENGRWGPTKENATGYREAMEKVLTAGSRIYQYLKQQPATRELVEAVESLPDNKRISINTPDLSIPWEIVYPFEFSYDWPEGKKKLYPTRMWGYRWEFETMLDLKFPDREFPAARLPTTRTQPGMLDLRIGVGATVDSGHAGFSARARHEEYCKKNPACHLLDGSDAIKAALQKDNYPGSLLYLMCHGKSAGGEELEFSPRFTANPYTLTPEPYPNWPVVFLNSCSSAAFQPHNFTSFLQRFRRKNAYGLVAASFRMPIVFGTLYACEFMDAYCNGRRLGEILLELRRKALDQQNPLAFFYTLQCPLDVRRQEVKQ
jgi:hypothetical protein